MEFNLQDHIINMWRSGFTAVWYVTEETDELIASVQSAMKRLAEDEERAEDVGVLIHDKYAGFYGGMAPIQQPDDKTHMTLRALQCFFGDPAAADVSSPPFDPQDNLVCVFKDIHVPLKADPTGTIIQFLRNAVQGNMGDQSYAQAVGLPSRGNRMMILVTPTDKLPDDLPELDPTIVPLPGDESLSRAIDGPIKPLVENSVIPEISEEHRIAMIQSLRGLTYQKAEDTISLVITSRTGIERGQGVTDIGAITDMIDRQKAQAINRVPGLDYIAYDQLPADELPGYEPVYHEIDTAMLITPEMAARHRMPTLTGMAFIGIPGTGKSVAALTAARRLHRICLKLDLGAAMGSLVGQSENNIRRALQIADAMGAVLFIDDLDKAGLKQAASGNTGDSGVSSRMLNTLLTYMASNPKAIVIMTLNRLNNVPPELMRAGRIDHLFYVEPPCSSNRLAIAKVHMGHHRVNLDDEVATEITRDLMDGWVGAEIADAIRKSARQTIARGSDQLDEAWLREYAANYRPQSGRDVNKADLEQIEAAGSQLTRIGRTPVTERPVKAGRGQRRAGI